MLRKPTRLVLGAGASKPYGFPTGVQLTRDILSGLNPGQVLHNQLTQFCNYSEDRIREFRNALLFSGKNSVDAFLEHRVEHTTIGKIAIAATLITREHAGAVFGFDDSWLRYLYNNLNTTFDEFHKNRLGFVNFNYDRSVEFFLYTALTNTYNKSEDDIVETLSHVPVVHLHGRLGFLPWEKSNHSRPYDSEINKHSLSVSAQSIKIIHENVTEHRDVDFEKAKQLMADAGGFYSWALATIF